MSRLPALALQERDGIRQDRDRRIAALSHSDALRRVHDRLLMGKSKIRLRLARRVGVNSGFRPGQWPWQRRAHAI